MLTTNSRRYAIGLRIQSMFGTGSRPQHRQADLIFKDYYSRRLTLTPHDHHTFFRRLTTTSFNQQDHRWQSLTQNLSLNLTRYSMLDRVYMLKGLIEMGSQVALVDTLMEDMVEHVGKLGLEEAVVGLWCIGRVEGRGRARNQVVIGLLERIKELLGVGQGQYKQQQIVLKGGNTNTELNQVQNCIQIHPKILAMLFTSLSSLSITDPPLLKTLIRQCLQPNLPHLQTTSLCVFLVALDRLKMRNQRISLKIYQEVRKRPNEVENASVGTLVNLAHATASLYQRKPSLQEQERMEKYEDERSRREEELADMRTFYLWLCETILLKSPSLSPSRSALLLLHSAKLHAFDPALWQQLIANITKDIMQAKVVDLVMAISSLAKLTKDKRGMFEKEEKGVSVRLWQLESSIDGRSEQVLGELVRDKKIWPPVKIAQRLMAAVQEKQKESHVRRQNSKQ